MVICFCIFNFAISPQECTRNDLRRFKIPNFVASTPLVATLRAHPCLPDQTFLAFLRVTDHVYRNISIHVIPTNNSHFGNVYFFIKVAISQAGNKQSTPNLQRRSIRGCTFAVAIEKQKHFCRHMVGFRVHGHI